MMDWHREFQSCATETNEDGYCYNGHANSDYAQVKAWVNSEMVFNVPICPHTFAKKI
jgi:hypothetical protein